MGTALAIWRSSEEREPAGGKKFASPHLYRQLAALLGGGTPFFGQSVDGVSEFGLPSTLEGLRELGLQQAAELREAVGLEPERPDLRVVPPPDEPTESVPDADVWERLRHSGKRLEETLSLAGTTRSRPELRVLDGGDVA